jgi:UDP-2-acetamido-2,6-beta-L-arabino-hexul-4-ose reductase
MNVLITGANGFVGKNLKQRLFTIQDGRDRTRPGLSMDEILLCTRDTSEEALADYCQKADFVVHLAGVNRPKDPEEFAAGNRDFTCTLLELLRKSGNRCPVLLSSSIQAGLTGRYAGSPYGQSKKAAEELLLVYSEETGAAGMIYRLPNLFGKWCRPNYNSAVATFCHNIARDLPITVSDPAVELELVYIDDLVEEILNAVEGHPRRTEGAYCSVPVSHHETLGEIVRLLQSFHHQPQTLLLPEIPAGSFAKKLYSTYLSYLPPEKTAFPLKMNVDPRGSFTELLKTGSCGQVSVNISKPGITKGQHWHNSKWEFFMVVAGHGLIRERNLNTGELVEFEVSGEKIEAVHMLPGYTHNIINLSETENLVTVMWANEPFDSNHPDTYFEEV